MYGARYIGNLNGGTSPITKRFLIKASEVITKGDWITVDGATGKVDVAAADEPLLGVANETVTGNAGGTNKVEIILAMPGTLFIMDNDNVAETFAQDDVGEWHAITGTTGAQQVDTNADAAAPSSSANQVLCLEYNPQGHGLDSDTSIGLYTPTYTYFACSYTE
jgi:hypothetical protein